MSTIHRRCEACGGAYEALRASSRFCGATCRSRHARGARAVPTAASPGGLAGAVEEELAAAGRLETALGQVTRLLAVRLESGRDTGSGVASLARELRATLDLAVAGARVADSPSAQMRDELAERRGRRHA